MIVFAPPVVTTAAQRGSSSLWLTQLREMDVRRQRRETELARDRACARSSGSRRSGVRPGPRRGAQHEGVLVVRGSLGDVHPRADRSGCASSHAAASGGVGGCQTQRADVVHARRQVAAVVVELGEAPDQVERRVRRRTRSPSSSSGGRPCSARNSSIRRRTPLRERGRVDAGDSARAAHARAACVRGTRGRSPSGGASGPGITRSHERRPRDDRDRNAPRAGSGSGPTSSSRRR